MQPMTKPTLPHCTAFAADQAARCAREPLHSNCLGGAKYMHTVRMQPAKPPAHFYRHSLLRPMPCHAAQNRTVIDLSVFSTLEQRYRNVQMPNRCQRGVRTGVGQPGPPGACWHGVVQVASLGFLLAHATAGGLQAPSCRPAHSRRAVPRRPAHQQHAYPGAHMSLVMHSA